MLRICLGSATLLCVLAAVHIAKGLDYEEALIALVVAFALHRGLEQVGQPDRRPSRCPPAVGHSGEAP